jgi:phenylpropionate dioxygenase-like ring-hydroxylating dioxygenase large terminal subunit
MCRHRGNRVVRCDDGNAKRFMCTYHGWTYRNDGALEYIPGEAEAYYGALDKPSHGLIEARVGTYAGIVFATWAEDAPSLEPISATLAGISTRHSIAGTAECRRWAR